MLLQTSAEEIADTKECYEQKLETQMYHNQRSVSKLDIKVLDKAQIFEAAAT